MPEFFIYSNSFAAPFVSDQGEAFVETDTPPAIAPSPSVAGFKEWLERQPGEQTFYYGDPRGCALDQYLWTVGTDCCSFYWKDTKLYTSLKNFPSAANWKTKGRPTFGDVLAEIEKAGL